MKLGDDILEMVEAINRAVKGDELDLTSWEEGLLISVSERVQRGIPITGPQEESLDIIWKKATGQ